jgi:hypothetical protein
MDRQPPYRRGWTTAGAWSGRRRRLARVHRSTPFRPPHRGRQAVRDYVTQAFADEQRIDDVRFGTPVVQGDRACVAYCFQFGGPVTVPASVSFKIRWEATGRRERRGRGSDVPATDLGSQSAEQAKQFSGMVHQAFPDLHVEVHDVIAEGELVAPG